MTIAIHGLRRKLTAAFFVVSCAMGLFAAAAIAIELDTIERAARLEAEHVVATIATPGIDDAIHNPAFLQAQIDILHRLHKRDIVILNANKVGIADADPREIGEPYTSDNNNEVGQTLLDGHARFFTERNEHHPEGAMQVVGPLRQITGDASSPIVGAVILEYTPIYDALYETERNEIYALGAAGVIALLFAGVFGWQVARRLSARVSSVQRAVTGIAGGLYETRVEDSGQDEVGLLARAFNAMAAELGRSRSELIAYQHELERRVEDRTRELSQANERLLQEAHERERTAERIEYLAYHDSLTRLPNRTLFGKLLEQSIREAKRNSKFLAVLFVDLDRFKQINDTLGHEAGDLLLQEVAHRLRACLRQSDVVARLGGDEFVVMLIDLSEESFAGQVAEKLLAAVSRPVVLLGHEFHVTCSVGISTYPAAGTDEAALMKNADIAMYQAKEDGKNGFRFYTEQLSTASLERLALESSLRAALQRNEFELHYQPKIDLSTGAVTGMEALLRWHHPQLGTVAPAKFIPLAEETGLIVPIGKWVLRTACAQRAHWCKRNFPVVAVAVNLSPRQFADAHLLHDVEAILRETGLDPRLLELEITESMLMQNPAHATQTLHALKGLGVRLAIDDFGTGYSSLSNLKLFPVHTIKIDRSFIRNLPSDVEDKAITDAIISMGRTLSLTVVAEGVETQEQAEFLRSHLCDEFQGFYFSKPVPAARLEEVINGPHSEEELMNSSPAIAS